MKVKQIKAIKSLEKAFEKCKEAGLVFYGADMDLLCFDEKEYDKVFEEHDDIGTTVNKMSDDKYVKINTSKAYIDSCGY